MGLILNKDVQQIDHEEIFCVALSCDMKFALFLKSNYEDFADGLKVEV
jgi:hypothetical protein